MGTFDSKPRVYVEFVHQDTKTRRVLDLEWINQEPVAVIAWAKIDGHLEPADYVRLDRKLLRRSAQETWWYDGEVADPRYREPRGGSA